MSSREEFEAWLMEDHGLDSEWQVERNCFKDFPAHLAYQAWLASREQSDLLAALKAITNSGPDAIPIKEAFEMAHRAIERAIGGKV